MSDSENAPDGGGTSTNETELIRAAKAGDMDSFERLIHRYERMIFNYVLRVVSRREDAEDVTQETFLKCYRRIGSLTDDGKFRSWLYAIATNTAYDWLRKRIGSRELFIIDDPESNFETIADDTASYLEKAADAKDLDRALERIRPVYRSVLLLYYREGFEYREIAAIFSVPLNTVKTYLRRAKEALKDEITKRQ